MMNSRYIILTLRQFQWADSLLCSVFIRKKCWHVACYWNETHGFIFSTKLFLPVGGEMERLEIIILFYILMYFFLVCLEFYVKNILIMIPVILPYFFFRLLMHPTTKFLITCQVFPAFKEHFLWNCTWKWQTHIKRIIKPTNPLSKWCLYWKKGEENYLTEQMVMKWKIRGKKKQALLTFL